MTREELADGFEAQWYGHLRPADRTRDRLMALVALVGSVAAEAPPEDDA